MRNFDIVVRDTSVARIEGKEQIIAKKSTTRTMFKVNLFLEGNDLPFVDKVTYTLHDSFKNKIKKIQRSLSNPNCRLIFYAWGTFTVKVKIETLNGENLTISHPLQFGREVQSGKYGFAYK